MIIAAAAVSAIFISCASESEAVPVIGSDPQWLISIIGMQDKRIDSLQYAEAMDNSSHRREMSLEFKGETHTYIGLSFSRIAAMVDNPAGSHPGYQLDEELWNRGYDITLTGENGYSATFNTADIAPDSLMLSAEMDGEAVSPRIVGDVPSRLWVENPVSVELDLVPEDTGEVSASADETVLTMTVNEETTEFTRSDLEASPWYTGGRGSFTTSAGTTYTNNYGGVRLADFLRSFIKLEADSMVTFVAADGYEMSYNGEQILDESDGLWILAFRMDGEYLPLDPGYFRTVKIGKFPGEIPNIEGHSSVRMIAGIRIGGESYRDFTLEMKGRKDFVLDRQTLQSGVSCHGRSVIYYSKKTDENISYTGIPLWRLLAFSDDPDYAPHKQDPSVISYSEEALSEGYLVVISAADGFSISLDSSQVNRNDDVIIAMYRNGEELSDREFPLIIVWDKDASLVPEGIKSVRNIKSIELVF